MPAIAPGLHLIATPIGAARDITLRALDLLAGCDLLVAEDTRSLRRLMELHGVALNGRRVLPYHDHNGAQMRPKLLQALREGQSVLYASEAGTPLVSDPGFGLARAAIDAGLPVLAAPGASAVMAALCVAGPAKRQVLFLGLPACSSRGAQTYAGRGRSRTRHASVLRIAQADSPILKRTLRQSWSRQASRALS